MSSIASNEPDGTERPLRVLALEPYYGGSHRAMLDAWTAASRHSWTLLTLPPYHWKWRMRHSAVTFAKQVNALSGDAAFDVLFTCSMLDLATFRGLVDARFSGMPTVVYFHENQLTYPVRKNEPRDLHFGLTNMTTALAADSVWFNSAFHRDDFLNALSRQLKRLPSAELGDPVREIREKSLIEHPNICAISRREPKSDAADTHVSGRPLRILWAARWEHDKNPEDFFAALRILDRRGVKFEVAVVGQQFDDVPAVFDESRDWLGDRVIHWGYQASRAEYESAVRECDVVVSTAMHEFFGIAILEAISAGLFPLLPNRLAYPELLPKLGYDATACRQSLHDGSPEDLAQRLDQLAELAQDSVIIPDEGCAQQQVDLSRQLFGPKERADAMDDIICRITVH